MQVTSSSSSFETNSSISNFDTSSMSTSLQRKRQRRKFVKMKKLSTDELLSNNNDNFSTTNIFGCSLHRRRYSNSVPIILHVTIVLLLLVSLMTDHRVSLDPASSERSSRKSHSRSSSSQSSLSLSSSISSLSNPMMSSSSSSSSSSSQLNPLSTRDGLPPPSTSLSVSSSSSNNSSTAITSSSSSGLSSDRVGSGSGTRMECSTALGKCTRRMTCGIALHDYRISCKQELYGVAKNSCSEICQLSIISLASTPEGYDYLHCDCAQNDYCKLIRQRTEPCHPQRNVKPEYELCRGAELVCRADTVCNTSYDYYKRHCNDLIRGKTRECSRRCNNTVSLLWRQKSGHSLRNCTCEKGSIKCRREREAIMRSCLGLEGFKAGYTSKGHSHHHHNLRHDRFLSKNVFHYLFVILTSSIIPVMFGSTTNFNRIAIV